MNTLTLTTLAQPGIDRPRLRLRSFALQAAAELRRHLRAPDFATAAIALPLFFYLIVGISRAAEPVPGGGTVGGYLIVVFSIFGVLSVSLSGIGHVIADERARGDLRLVRVTPLPAVVYLAAKLLFVLVASTAIIVLLGIEGAVTGARLPFTTWLATAGLLLAGSLALAPIGFLVGFLVRPGSAGAVNLFILMPLSFTAGVFTSVYDLPAAVRRIAELTPTYHLSVLAQWMTGLPVSAQPIVDIAWVVGWGIASAVAALLIYRRFVGSQFA
jgi:ABC-2 type transport system permease protein